MKWFKHDSSANMDSKVQEILLDYGLEGYGLYFYCLELIAQNVQAHNLTFELEHDARIIARNTGSTVEKVQTMMSKMVELGLFENGGGRITCLKMMARTDEYTQRLLTKENKDLMPCPDTIGTKSDNVRLNRKKDRQKERPNREFLENSKSEIKRVGAIKGISARPGETWKEFEARVKRSD